MILIVGWFFEFLRVHMTISLTFVCLHVYHTFSVCIFVSFMHVVLFFFTFRSLFFVISSELIFRTKTRSCGLHNLSVLLTWASIHFTPFHSIYIFTTEIAFIDHGNLFFWFRWKWKQTIMHMNLKFIVFR